MNKDGEVPTWLQKIRDYWQEISEVEDREPEATAAE